MTYKFGLNGAGQIHGFRYNLYVLHGANVKLPTLQQLFYFDAQLRDEDDPPGLYVERNIGSEAGLRLEKELPNLPTILRLRRIKMDFAVFRNSYLDKIAEIINRASLPTPFNTKLALTTGFESRLSLGLFEDMLEWEGAVMFLDISDPRVFKFKPDYKVTSDLWFRFAGFSANVHGFSEGRQTALMLATNLVAWSTLPPRWDLDCSLQKEIAVKSVEGFFNLAVRNFRNSGQGELSGFFLQDRRWYVSLGVQL